MMVCSGIFCAGVVLETIRSGTLMTFYMGRTICGLGIGGSATIIPIYLGEMSPKEIRARLGSCYQFTFTIGILISYWVDYAVAKLLPSSSSKQWQIPMALQLVPGALMGLGMLTLHESVRWLLFHNANNHTQNKVLEEQAWASLAWVRGGGTDEVHAEFNTIKTGVETELQTRADFHLSELITHKPNLHRLFLGFTIFLAQQSTGATALAYFGPQFFAMLVGPGDKNLLLTGVFGGVKAVACFVFVVFIAERFGRKPCLIYGALVMSVCMVITAFVVKAHPPPEPLSRSSTSSDEGGIPTAGLITVLLIYLNIIAFNLSWGPLPWPCISEIFPTRIREPGVAFGVASQWLFNFLWSSTTPYIMAGIGWATFLLFGILDLLFAGFVIGFLMETKGKSLEEITALFDGPSYLLLGEEDDGFKRSDREEQVPLRS